MEDGEIDGNKVILDWAKPKGEGGFGGRGGGRGGFGGRGGGRGGRGGFGGRGRGGFGGKAEVLPCAAMGDLGSEGTGPPGFIGISCFLLQGEEASEAAEEAVGTTSHKGRRQSLSSPFPVSLVHLKERTLGLYSDPICGRAFCGHSEILCRPMVYLQMHIDNISRAIPCRF